MRRAWFVIAGLVLACQEGPKRHCSEFDQVQAEFDEINMRLLDLDFADPAYVDIATKFEAIPSDCERRPDALATARTIRTAQNRRRSEPPPPPRRVKARAGGIPFGEPGIVCRVRANRESGRTIRLLCMTETEVQPALDACVRWGEANVVQYPTAWCVCERVEEISREKHCPIHQPYE